MMKYKKTYTLILFVLTFFNIFGELPKIKHNPWELIIYRPENSRNLNEIRCYIKIEDENGNDVSRTKVKAQYEWVSSSRLLYDYKKKYWLSGGVAAHLNLQKGKYRISVYTPLDEQYPYPSTNRNEWKSNVFEYDTQNPTKVIFVYPQANDNGFYTGHWIIDYKAPKFYEITKPQMIKTK